MGQSKFAGFHPWVNLLYLALALILTMMTMHPVMVLLSFVLSFCYARLLCGKVVWKRGIGCGIPVAIFAMGVLPLFYHNGVTPLFYLNGMAVTREAVIHGGMMTLLLLAVLQWFFVWNEMMGEDKLLYLIGRALPSAALVLSMALRMVPLFGKRLREIHEAQAGLGGGMQNGMVGKAGQRLREVSVLVSWELEESIETSVSMESRGYATGKRTSFHLFRWRCRDLVVAAAFVLLAVPVFGALFQGRIAVSYFPEIWYTKESEILLPYLLCYGTLLILPIGIDLCFFWRRKRCGRIQKCPEELDRKYLEQWFGEKTKQ